MTINLKSAAAILMKRARKSKIMIYQTINCNCTTSIAAAKRQEMISLINMLYICIIYETLSIAQQSMKGRKVTLFI